MEKRTQDRNKFSACLALASMFTVLTATFPSPALAAGADSVSATLSPGANTAGITAGNTAGNSVEVDSPGDAPPDNRPDLVIGPGFLIQLGSSQDSRLNGRFRIRPDGSVDLPYNVTLDTQGMTLARLREAVISRYQPLFRTVPRLSVAVVQKKFWIDVGGIVGRPGAYLVSEKSSLDEIMSASGGLTDDSTSGYVRIDSDEGKIHWVDLGAYFKDGKGDVPPWKGGEHVFFQLAGPEDGSAAAALEEKKVRVVGEVKNPGELLYKKDGDGYYYLAQTGGPTTYSDLDHVELVRRDPKTDLRLVTYQPISEITNLQPSDMLIVPPVRVSTGEKTLTTVALIVGVVSASLLAFVAVRGTR